MKFSQFCLKNIDITEAEIILIGINYEDKNSSRLGAMYAPTYIRKLSDTIESFNPYLQKDLQNYNLYDLGDITPLNQLNIDNLEFIYKEFKNIFEKRFKYFIIGGSHNISYPIIKLLNQEYNNLQILHLDAHPDYQDSYINDKYSYASVFKRISEFINPKNIYQIGIRTGEKDEVIKAEKETNFYPLYKYDFKESINLVFEKLDKNFPLYISFDIDIFSPIYAKATSNPTIGGINDLDYIYFIKKLKEFKANIIAADLVEVIPQLDFPDYSTCILAAQIIRDIILLMK